MQLRVFCFFFVLFFFFFQAEDGIRDIGVTGVQTCALPIYVCWVCKWNVLWVSQKASGCAFEKLITQIFLKCRTYFSSCPFSNCAKLKLTKYPVTVFFYHFWPGPSFLVILIHFFKKLFSLRRQNAAHEYNSYN